MLDQILSYIPAVVVNVPRFGEVDITPYISALVVLFILIVAFKLLQNVIIAHLKKLSEKTKNDIDDMLIGVIAGIQPWVYTLVSLYIVLQLFTLPSWAERITTVIFLFVVVWQVIEGVVAIVDFGAKKLIEKDEDGDGVIDQNSAAASNMVTFAARLILWALGGLFVLSNLGVEVTSLIAGLGIGGIAIAFALQNILSDLFSSFSIHFDKPFRVGDHIVIGEHSGTVEKIGIKTTRIRTLQGEELVVSNAELTSARVQNFKKMQERRITFSFGILYETPRAVVEKVPNMVKSIFSETDGARLNRVHFTSFGDSALIFDVVYHVESADYAVYLDIQHAINLHLMKTFEDEGIEFAYPTQTLYIKK